MIYSDVFCMTLYHFVFEVKGPMCLLAVSLLYCSPAWSDFAQQVIEHRLDVLILRCMHFELRL